MYELKVTVTKILGTCTADPPLERGDHFTVRDGDITIPEGGYICLWALQSLLPLVTPKEREICERKDEDWMWRVHHAQCPDPKGRVIFRIERTARLEKRGAEVERPNARTSAVRQAQGVVNPSNGEGPKVGECESPEGRDSKSPEVRMPGHEPVKGRGQVLAGDGNGNGRLRDLRVVVEHVDGKCTSRMQPGDCFLLRSGRLYIPGGHFCLYALHAALPLLPAKQRSSHDGDWLAEDDRVICPDPAGNVILKIEVER